MNATQKKTVLDILIAVRDNDIESSGTKRSLTATLKKVQAGSIVAVDGVTAALTATADKATIDTDAKTLRDMAKRIVKYAGTARQTAVKATKAVRAGSGKGATRKTAVKAVQTGDAGTVTVRTNGRKAVTKVQKLVTDADVFRPVIDLLSANKVKHRLEDDPTNGVTLVIDHKDWTYKVWSPDGNSNGPDEGWVIGYTQDAESEELDYAEPMLNTADDVNTWLIEDLGLKAPKRTAPVPTSTRNAAKAHDGSVATVVNASRVLMEQARNLAEGSPEPHDATTMALFQQIIDAQVGLRRILDGDKK